MLIVAALSTQKRCDQEYASSQKFQIIEAHKILLHLKTTILMDTIALL